LATLVRLSHALHAATCRIAQRWDDRGVWTADGSRSAAARLARDTSTSRLTARRLLRHAHALAELPQVTGALTAGAISPDHVDVLTAVRCGREEVLARDER